MTCVYVVIDNYSLFVDEAGKISRSGSAQNIHPSSRESSVPRQVPSRNASQNASQSSAPPTLTDDQLTRACATIYQEFDSNNDLKVRESLLRSSIQGCITH